MSGPGGVGKGTLVRKLVDQDPKLWLSRSWTTRPPRAGESAGAYHFVDVGRFRERADRGGFLEWAEFLGHLYGTPVPDPPPGRDVLLEIDVQGAEQVRAKHPDAALILVVAPSPGEQRRRLAGRGDGATTVERRLRQGRDEESRGRRMADHLVVNDELDRAVQEVAGIIDSYRRGARVPGGTPAGCP